VERKRKKEKVGELIRTNTNAKMLVCIGIGEAKKGEITVSAGRSNSMTMFCVLAGDAEGEQDTIVIIVICGACAEQDITMARCKQISKCVEMRLRKTLLRHETSLVVVGVPTSTLTRSFSRRSVFPRVHPQ
jgi:hypothetical protein